MWSLGTVFLHMDYSKENMDLGGCGVEVVVSEPISNENDDSEGIGAWS